MALVIEASLKLHQTLPTLSLLILCSFATQFFYNGAYLLQRRQPTSSNQRAHWYSQNKNYLTIYQYSLLVVLFLALLYNLKAVERWPSIKESTLLISLCLLSIAYYGIPWREKRISLRNLGWSKPFVIAFAWTGMTVWLPEIAYHLTHHTTFNVVTPFVLISLNNFILITLLAIVFDVKDYADDKNDDIRTFVVRFGLGTTITKLLLPLALLGSIITWSIGYYFDYQFWLLVMQLLPYLLVFVLIFSLKNERSIYFYLLLVDGAIILKGCCGIGVALLSL